MAAEKASLSCRGPGLRPVTSSPLGRLSAPGPGEDLGWRCRPARPPATPVQDRLRKERPLAEIKHTGTARSVRSEERPSGRPRALYSLGHQALGIGFSGRACREQSGRKAGMRGGRQQRTQAGCPGAWKVTFQGVRGRGAWLQNVHSGSKAGARITVTGLGSAHRVPGFSRSRQPPRSAPCAAFSPSPWEELNVQPRGE